MLILGLETSERICSVALTGDNDILSEYSIPTQKHAEVLPQLIDKTLKKGKKTIPEIDLYGISIGPGSFTSLRVGLSFIKGLALTAKKPIVAVCTLDALAKEAGYVTHNISPIIDAKRGEVYTALYKFRNGRIDRITYPESFSLKELIERTKEKTLFIGSGVQVWGNLLKAELKDLAVFVKPNPVSAHASTICILSRKKYKKGDIAEINSLEPLYIRASDAELKKHRITIELMKLEDLDEVIRIENESFNQPWSKVSFAYELKSRTSHPLVVKMDGKVVGYSVAWFVADEVHFGNIASNKKYRRMGLAHRLLARTIQVAKEKRCTKITLEVRVSNSYAISLYKKFGFKEVAIRKGYYRPEGEDAIIMLLDLTT